MWMFLDYSIIRKLCIFKSGDGAGDVPVRLLTVPETLKAMHYAI